VASRTILAPVPASSLMASTGQACMHQASLHPKRDGVCSPVPNLWGLSPTWPRGIGTVPRPSAPRPKWPGTSGPVVLCYARLTRLRP
jgi:hypothetical protein